MKKLVVVLLCLGNSIVQAQQKPHFSQYLINKFIVNPAVAGTDEYMEMVLSYRTQWVGLESSPKTAYLSFQGAGHHYGTGSGRVRNQNESWNSYGGIFMKDVTGSTSRTYGNFTYARNIALSKKIRLSMGSRLGLVSYSVEDDFIVRDEHDLLIDQGSSLVPDLSMGLFLYKKEAYYLSLSIDQMLSPSLSSGEVFEYQSNQGKLNWHYYVSGGFIAPASPVLKFAFTGMVKYAYPAIASVDLNVRSIYDDEWWVGVNYRIADSFSLLVGYVWDNNVEIGYSFDFTHSKLNPHNSGSHEIVLGLRLPFRRGVGCPAMFW